ncbi:hypothetical protein ACFYE2_16800 [Kocuria sp. CPCC 205300]
MGNRDARGQWGVVEAVPRDAVSGVTGEARTAQDGAGRTRPEHRNGRRP